MTEPYGGQPPFQAQSATSRAAAEAIMATYRTLRERVYRYIASCGDYGSTDDELEVFFAQVSINLTVAVRRVELEQMGFVRQAGRQRTTRSGHAAEVYVVTALVYGEGLVNAKRQRDAAVQADQVAAIARDAVQIKAAGSRREIYLLGFVAGRRTRRRKKL
jgi:hypothetical protein